MKTLLKNSRRRRKGSMVLCNGQLKIGGSILARGGGQKIRFQYCLDPNSSRHILYFRAIQGHSGGVALDPELQDSVLPKGFTEYIYHVGNVSEMHSIIRSGLIPGGRSLKRGRQDDNCMEETLCDLTKQTTTDNMFSQQIESTQFKSHFSDMFSSRHLEPKAPRQRSDPPGEPGVASTGRVRWEVKASMSSAGGSQNTEESSGTERICRDAGLRVLSGRMIWR